MRSAEIARVFGAFFGRPDGFGSSDFVRIEIFSCSIDLYGFREPMLLRLWIFWPNVDIAKVFGEVFGRPHGFGSSDFDRIEIFLCPIDLYGFREPMLLKIMEPMLLN